MLANAIGAVLRGEMFADPQMTVRIGAAACRQPTASAAGAPAGGPRRTTGQIARELSLSEVGVPAACGEHH